MATFMKKFKRKRRLSTELHSRWGDVSITYPTQGSWNQCNQPSGFVANASGRASSTANDEGRRYTPSSSLRQPSPSSSFRRSRSTDPREHTATSSPSFPTGYFDSNIRRRVGDDRPPPVQGLGIGDLRRDPSRNASSSIINDDTSDSSCDEEDEERDVLGAPVGLSPRIYEMADTSHTPRDNTDDYDIPAKSPPLSVTSRMRRCSIQSCATEPTPSVSGGTSSRRTSYTAASSISAPSMPPSTPRYGFNTPKQPPFPEKRYPPRPKTRESDSTPRQEMVPSYDELYG